jgi:hypothetical protein
MATVGPGRLQGRRGRRGPPAPRRQRGAATGSRGRPGGPPRCLEPWSTRRVPRHRAAGRGGSTQPAPPPTRPAPHGPGGARSPPQSPARTTACRRARAGREGRTEPPRPTPRPPDAPPGRDGGVGASSSASSRARGRGGGRPDRERLDPGHRHRFGRAPRRSRPSCCPPPGPAHALSGGPRTERAWHGSRAHGAAGRGGIAHAASCAPLRERASTLETDKSRRLDRSKHPSLLTGVDTPRRGRRHRHGPLDQVGRL